MPKVISGDVEWQRKSDARTLAEANAIKKDPKRLKGATQAAQELAEIAKKDAADLQSVSKFKPSKKK